MSKFNKNLLTGFAALATMAGCAAPAPTPSVREQLAIAQARATDAAEASGTRAPQATLVVESTPAPTQTATPTRTPEATPVATATPAPKPTETLKQTPAVTNTEKAISEYKLEGEVKIVNGWAIQLTDQAKKSQNYSQVQNVIKNIQALEPAKWSTSPNVKNPLIPSFSPANGVEIPDVGLRNYGQDVDNMVINPVANWSYMDYTGEYLLRDLPFSSKGGENGDMLIVFNLAEKVTSRIAGHFSQGWRLTGRFWNGDRLDQTIPALVGHTANNMLNLRSDLNPARGNAGANCDSVDGCDSVFVRVLIMDGNNLLAIIENEAKK